MADNFSISILEKETHSHFFPSASFVRVEKCLLIIRQNLNHGPRSKRTCMPTVPMEGATRLLEWLLKFSFTNHIPSLTHSHHDLHSGLTSNQRFLIFIATSLSNPPSSLHQLH